MNKDYMNKNLLELIYRALQDSFPGGIKKKTKENIASDITEKLKNDLFTINENLSYKEAKNRFKKEYIKIILRKNRGNISLIANILGIDRRTIHRILSNDEITEIKKEIIKPEYIKIEEVKNIIGSVVDKYKTNMSLTHYQSIYRNMEEISKTIVISLPEENLTLKDALYHFDKRFFKQMLNKEKSIKKLSKKLSMRYETLIRKLNSLGIEH